VSVPGSTQQSSTPEQAPDYEIVASTENSPYLLWQALLFHASCVATQGVPPTFVVHGEGPLLPGFQALCQLGGRILSAPSYRLSNGTEYPCRNTAGSLLEAQHDRPWTLICDPDFLFLRSLPQRAQSICGEHALSWDFVPYMRVGDHNRHWLAEACAERGVDPARLTRVAAGGVVPNLVRADVQRDFAQRWLAAVDTLVGVGLRQGEVPWVTIAWAFALAAAEMNLDLALTELTGTTLAGSRAPDSSLRAPILHYCYGDDLFDKRRYRCDESAAAVWSLEVAGNSLSASLVRRLSAARSWFDTRGVDVTNPALYRPPRLSDHAGSEPGSCFLDALSPRVVEVGYGALGTGGRLGYEDQQVLVGGAHFAHALGTHPPARLVFELGGRYARFRSRVSLNDDVQPGASEATFSVLGDGRLLAVASEVEPGHPATLEASLVGVQALELRVETSRWAYCHAVWLDPCLEPLSATE
jgi:hypothetical protein